MRSIRIRDALGRPLYTPESAPGLANAIRVAVHDGADLTDTDLVAAIDLYMALRGVDPFNPRPDRLDCLREDLKVPPQALWTRPADASSVLAADAVDWIGHEARAYARILDDVSGAIRDVLMATPSAEALHHQTTLLINERVTLIQMIRQDARLGHLTPRDAMVAVVVLIEIVHEAVEFFRALGLRGELEGGPIQCLEARAMLWADYLDAHRDNEATYNAVVEEIYRCDQGDERPVDDVRTQQILLDLFADAHRLAIE